MASFWFWFITCVAALIIGAVVFAGLFLLGSWFMDLVKYKIFKIPRKREKVSKWIEENSDKLENAPRDQFINKSEEVLKNDRRERDKFREFDKLRNEYLKGATRGREESNGNNEGSEQLKGRELLPNETSSPIRRDNEHVSLD